MCNIKPHKIVNFMTQMNQALNKWDKLPLFDRLLESAPIKDPVGGFQSVKGAKEIVLKKRNSFPKTTITWK